VTRPTVAKVDLDAFAHNYFLARRLHGGQALAVVKANAYGHGAVRCAQHLAGRADGFAVAFLKEAQTLRQAGIDDPILILEGCFDAEELECACELGLWTVVHQESQLVDLEQAAKASERQPINAWLKVNSGMARAGFNPDQVKDAYRRLRACSIAGDIVLMTHFACADEPEKEMTALQIAAFDAAVEGIPGDQSLCNSAGVLSWPNARRDWARPGILLYGAEPLPDKRHGLKPVMTLTGRVFAERTISAGESLGYGATFMAERETRVGLVAIGYADGYPRTAPTGTPVAVDGKVSRIIGRVSMDMLTVDLTNLAGVGVGSQVELWGNQIDVNEVAACAGTISYELLCNVKRVPILYGATALEHFPSYDIDSTESKVSIER